MKMAKNQGMGLRSSNRRTHPKNDIFVWKDHVGPYQIITETQAERYDRDGYFVSRAMLSRNAIATLEKAIDPLEARFAELARSRTVVDGEMQVSRPDEISFADHLAAFNSVVRTFTVNSSLVGMAVDLLGPDVRVYQERAVYKKSGTAKSFPWHQDSGYEFTDPQHYLTCWIPITDATVDNGCVWVKPGCHREGTSEHWPSETGYVCAEGDHGGVPAEAAVGDVLVFSSLTPHRSGSNLTDRVRKAYIVHYCVDGTRWVESKPSGYRSLVCDDPKRQYLVATGGKPIYP